MELLTIKQASELWQISTRRITKLCEDKRIKGAVKVAGIWLLPPDVEKPKDARWKSGKYAKGKNT